MGHKEVPVTHYEKVTREEIARRNYTEGTTRAYLRILDDLAGYFQRPPESLSPEQIREYTAHLFRDRHLADNTVNQMVGALRFFYLRVLNKPWRGHEMPYPKKSLHLPVIWSPDEIARLIDAAPTPFYRTILMTLYATGMRRVEVAALKLSDVDSARMVLHVQEGKGRKDRDIVLSPRLLEELRQHYRRLRRKPAVVAVPRWHASHRRHSHHRKGGLACVPPRGPTLPGQQASASPHASSHLLEGGADLRTIQLLLGHADLRETMIYIHLSKRHLGATAIPLDALWLGAKRPATAAAK